MPVDGDSLVEAPSRNTLETLASLDPSTPTKRVFGGNLTNKAANLHKLNQPPMNKKNAFFSNQKEAKSVYQNPYGKTPSKQKMKGSNARAVASLQQQVQKNSSKLNPEFAGVPVKDKAKDYEEYVAPKDDETGTPVSKSRVLYNLQQGENASQNNQAPTRKVARQSDLLIQTLTPQSTPQKHNTMDVLQNVSPTAGLEYDDSVAFAPSEEPIISATSGAKPGRITPVQMVSFETPGRISYSADYEAENNSPEPNADETPVQTPAPASPEMEATPAFKGIQLESFDASATTTDEPKALLHAVSEMAMPTEQQAAATIEPAAPTTTTVVEQSLDMARIRHVKQKRMQKNLIFGKLVAEFQTFLLRADQLSPVQEEQMIKMMDNLGHLQREMHELDLKEKELYGMANESSGSVITELTGVLAKQLLLGLCKVAPKSRRASKMDTSMNQSMNQNPNMVTMDRRALAGVESALNERVNEMNKNMIQQAKVLAQAKAAVRHMSMNNTQLNESNVSIIEDYYAQATDTLRQEVKSLRHSMYEMHMRNQEDSDRTNQERQFYQAQQNAQPKQKVNLRRKISRGFFGKKKRNSVSSQYDANGSQISFSTPRSQKGKRRTRFSTLFGTPKPKNK